MQLFINSDYINSWQLLLPPFFRQMQVMSDIFRHEMVRAITLESTIPWRFFAPPDWWQNDPGYGHVPAEIFDFRFHALLSKGAESKIPVNKPQRKIRMPKYLFHYAKRRRLVSDASAIRSLQKICSPRCFRSQPLGKVKRNRWRLGEIIVSNNPIFSLVRVKLYCPPNTKNKRKRQPEDDKSDLWQPK